MHPTSTNPRNNPDTEKYSRDATYQYLNSIQTYPTELKLKSIEILLKLIDSIIKHPYIDRYRILNLSSESLPMTFRQPFSIDFLKRIGFIEEYSDNQQLLCYCYSSTIPTLLTVQSILKDDKQGLGSDNFSTGERVSLIQRTDFDNFLKYREILTQDLLKKDSRSERVSINLSLDEMRTFCAELGVRTLQDILITYYKDPVLIENTVRSIVYSKRKADALLLNLKDFWEETEFIRTSAFYIYQCFSDKVSKSYLSDVNDPNSQFARRILSLSLVQAQNLVKITDTKICTLRGLLVEFMNWYCLADDDPDKGTFLEIIEGLSLGREKGPQFIENLELIICEKLSQQVQMKAMRLRADEYKSWCMAPPSFSDLPERNPTVDFNRDVSQWFQPHIIDTYFAITYSAQMLGTQLGARVTYDKNRLLVYLTGAKNSPTDFFSQAEASEALQSKAVGQSFNMKNVARTLYKNTSPASLFAAILNKHLDLLKEFLRNDLYLNIRDHKKRTLLHYAAFAGSIDITDVLLQKGMNADETDDLGKTPFDVAYEGNFYEGNISVCSLLIQSGVNPPLKVWEVLIDYSLTSDNVTYLELALRYDIPFVPSFHASLLRIPIKHQNPKVLKFIGEKLDHDTMRKFALIRDQEDKNALDYAYETRNEDIINLVEKVVGTDSVSIFPTIMKNQEAFIKNNQDALEYNIRFIKEREAKRKINSQIQGQAGTQLPTTLTMLANNPNEMDFPTRPPEKRSAFPRPNYSLTDFNRSYQGTTNITQLPPLKRPSLNDSLRHSSPQKRPPSGEFKSLRNGSPAPRSTNMSGYDLSPNDKSGQQGSGYVLKYPPERELVTGDLNEGMETLLATLKKRREEEQNKLKMQRENGCNVS